ncbi:MAG TPA: acylphosphatase [Gemmataceae bacterium]|nr:acylphosphatase [Gemmataceae bacterium]
MAICKRVVYSGRVQGVGFRYTAQHLAAGHAVAGHVRNLPDGDVELVIEGEADEVERFLAAVAGRMGRNIERTIVREAEPAGRRGFHIRH